MSQVQQSTDKPPLPADYQWPADEFFLSERYRAVYCPIPKVACSSLKLWWADIHQGDHSRYLSRDNRQCQVIEHEQLDNDFRIYAALDRVGREPLWSDDWFRFVFVRNPWARLVSAFVNKFVAFQPQGELVLNRFHQRWRPDAWLRLLQRATLPAWRKSRELSRDPLSAVVKGVASWRDHFTFRHFVEYLTTVDLNDFGDEDVDVHWMPQYRFLGGRTFHFVGRFERLEEDFRVVADRLGVATTLSSYNRTPYTSPELPNDGVADIPLHSLRKCEKVPHYRRFYTPELARVVGDLYRQDVEQFGYDF